MEMASSPYMGLLSGKWDVGGLNVGPKRGPGWGRTCVITVVVRGRARVM